MYAYFREIGRLSPIDVTLYNIPMLASPIDVPTVKRLAEEFPLTQKPERGRVRRPASGREGVVVGLQINVWQKSRPGLPDTNTFDFCLAPF